MAARYSAPMPMRQPFPALWLVSDRRNDPALGDALRRLPAGSAFVFRHYHLGEPERRQRWEELARLARARGHLLVLADSPRRARAWGAHGVYGPPDRLGPRRGLIRVAAVHDAGEIAAANRAGADALLLSPVFPTRSHPGAGALGPVRFRLLAARAAAPVVALGGMTPHRAQRIGWPAWAAIDGLTRAEAETKRES